MFVAAPQGLELKPRCYSPPRSSTTAGITLPEEDDFAFDYKEDLERTSLSADELFHGGKIRSLQLLQLGNLQTSGKLSESEKPICLIAHKMSPNHDLVKTRLDRGKIRASSHGNRVLRSLSPARVSAYPWETKENEEDKKGRASLKGSSSRRWKLMDLLLFRSSLEVRVTRTEEHAPTKCILLKKHGDGMIKNLGFRCKVGYGENTVVKRLESGHDLQHYAANRVAAKDLRKRTFLPYKKGILFVHGY